MTTDAPYYLGIMSGTSLDAVDTVIAEFDAQGKPILIAQAEYPLPLELKAEILALCTDGPISLPQLGQVDHQLGLLFAKAVIAQLQQAHLSPDSIRAIGSHGQTIWHQPYGETPFTLQIGDANLIATHTGIDTVADFRRKDIALGGQGAPLVPAFHQRVFAKDDITSIILNIGGIANITLIQPHQATIGYDTGPGNMLMDYWVYQHTQQRFDKDAQYAEAGKVHEPLLTSLKSDSYFSLPAPKSTGRELFNAEWLQAHLQGFNAIKPEDVQRTLLEFTAQTISDAILAEQQQRGFSAGELIVCGGGANNPLLMQRLRTLLPNWHVSQSPMGDCLEALAFAWLAYRHVHGLAGNLPEVTGASRPTILGAYYPAQ